MKGFYFTILFLLFAQIQISGQVLNIDANWPDANWTISGTYSSSGLISDPTINNTFSFDDFAAGFSSNDDIAAESPVIDLTPAHNANEMFISISTNDYSYYKSNSSEFFKIQYWDDDNSLWQDFDDIISNSGNSSYNNCSSGILYSQSIDITAFTTNQLGGFRYRFIFDDNDGQRRGFCLQSTIIKSASQPTCGIIGGATITINNQTDVNNFVANHCNTFLASLEINDNNDGVDDIVNLDGLVDIDFVGGDFTIRNCNSLTTVIYSGANYATYSGAKYATYSGVKYATRPYKKDCILIQSMPLDH